MIYITGDMHGDLERFSDSKLKKLKKGDTLIICGDFGFVWDGGKDEQKKLTHLGKLKYNVCFIDGTHENFDLLNAYEISEWNGGKVHHIGGNLYHLMRGQIFTIEGYHIFTMGGGESPDIDIRFDTDAWSRYEIPSQAELYEGASNLSKQNLTVDIVVTHEPPARIKGFLNLKNTDATRTTTLNAYFEEIAKNCEFHKWYFGSMHLDKYISSIHTSVYKNIINAVSGETVKK